jgi:hypothetical protein
VLLGNEASGISDRKTITLPVSETTAITKPDTTPIHVCIHLMNRRAPVKVVAISSH